MSIQVNAGANAVNWDALLGKLGEVTKTEGADGAAGTTNVTIMRNVDGIATPVTINIPNDLELPQAVDQAGIDSLCEKLSADTGLNISKEQIEHFHDALTNVLKETVQASGVANPKASAAKNAMFDLYKLMALLVEVAQKQRDANREMRQAESEAIQHSILSQAQAQRDAAITGMVASAICCGLQIAATSVALYQQGKAFKTQLGTDKTAGLDVARQNVDMLKAANNHQNAQQQLNNVKADIGQKLSLDGGNRTIQSKVEGSFNNPDFNADATRFADAKGAFQRNVELNQTLQGLGSPERINDVTTDVVAPLEGTGVAEIKTAVAKLDSVKAEMAKLDQIQGLSPEDKAFFVEQMTSDAPNVSLEATDRMMTLRQQHPELNNVNLNEGDSIPKLQANVKASIDKAVADIQPQIAEGGPLRNEVNAAKQELRAQVKLEMMKFEDAYDAELQNFNEVSKSGTKAEIAEAKARLETAGNELKYARALGNEKLMAGELTDSQAHLADVEEARAKHGQVQTSRANSVDYIKASNTINTAQAVNGLISSIFGFAQGFIQNKTQLNQAEATMEGAEQQKKQEELEQTKDLFNQAQELVNNVVQLMKAIGQAETQSMRDAIQA